MKGILGSNSRFLRGNYRRLKKYMYDFWNAVDLLSYVLLIIALFVPHFYPSTTFTIARRMFSLSVLVMYLRFLEVFLIHRRLGPTLIMIKEMVRFNWNLYLILKNNSRQKNEKNQNGITWYTNYSREKGRIFYYRNKKQSSALCNLYDKPYPHHPQLLSNIVSYRIVNIKTRCTFFYYR